MQPILEVREGSADEFVVFYAAITKILLLCVVQQSAGKEEPKQSNVITTTTVTVTDGKDFVATSRVFTQPMCHTVTNAAPLPGSITPASAANPAFSSKGDLV